MPLAILAWFANILFIAIPILIAFLVVSIAVNPPRTVGEAFFESHKIVLIGGVTLSGVALTELFLLFEKLPAHAHELEAPCLAGAFVLIACIVFGLLLFAFALIRGIHIIDDKWPARLHAALGVVILITSVYVAMKYKYIDLRIAEFQQLALSDGDRR